MKHFLAASSLAILLAAGSQQSASAWCSFQFGIGMNVAFSCGGHGNRQGPPPYDLYGPGYGGGGGPIHAGYMNPGYGHSQMPATNFIAPAPTPLGTHSLAPTDYVYPAAYPASYQPMSYPAGYYPMSYYGYYGQ